MEVSSSWLDTQHRRLDHALAEVEFLAERRAFGSAARRFREFKELFLEHMRLEEEDERFAALVGPAHAKLLTALESVESALAQGDFGEFCYGLNALAKLIAAHEHDEEQLAE